MIVNIFTRPIHDFAHPGRQDNWLGWTLSSHDILNSGKNYLQPWLLLIEVEWHICISNVNFKSVARASAGMLLRGCVGQTTCIVVSELILSTWVKSNTRYDSKCEYIVNGLQNNSTC